MTRAASGSAHHQPAAAFERDAEQDGAGERAVDEGNARLGGEDRVTQLLPGMRFWPTRG